MLNYGLSYAGIGLALETPEIRAYLDQFHTLDQLVEVSLGGIPGVSLDNLPNSGSERVGSEPAVGVLHFPRSCSHPAVFKGVVSASQLDRIRAVVDEDGEYQELSMSGGNYTPAAFSMKMLPPRPLMLIAGYEQLYLLTLVDYRYDLAVNRSAEITETSATWEDLYAALATALDLTLTVETVDPAYGVPSDRWIQYRTPLCSVLDAVAETLGQKVVFNGDGSARVVNWETALTNSAAQVALYRKTGGGVISSEDIQRFVPESVTTIFKKELGGVVQAQPLAVEDPLASLSVAGFDSATGVTGCTHTLFADLIYDGTNDSDCADYSAAAAEDFYGWQLANLDITLADTVPWVATGSEESITWTFSLIEQGAVITTRIQRGPWTGFPTGGIVDSGVGSSSGCTDYEDRCESGYLRRYICNDQGEYEWDRDLGVPCTPQEEDPNYDEYPNDPVYPVIADVVTKVCKPCGDNIGDVVIKPTATSLGTCWLLANGGTANRTTYAALFAVYGTTHGSGNGSTTFGLPNLADPVTGLSYFIRAGDPTLTVERRRLTVFAAGQVSPAECSTDLTCCPEEVSGGDYGVGGASCCPNLDLVESITGSYSGPIGVDGATCALTWTLNRDSDDGLAWFGESEPGEGDCANAVLTSRLWCSKGQDDLPHWYVVGDWIDGGGMLHEFGPLTLGDDGEYLTVAVTVPGEEVALTLAFERPCSTEHSFTCVDDACVSQLGAGGDYETRGACEAVCGAEPVACTPAVGGPFTVYFKVSNTTAGASCLEGYTDEMSGSDSAWDRGAPPGFLLCVPYEGGGTSLHVTCYEGFWRLYTPSGGNPCTSGQADVADGAFASVATTSPLYILFPVVSLGDCFGGGQTCSIEISDAPF